MALWGRSESSRGQVVLARLAVSAVTIVLAAGCGAGHKQPQPAARVSAAAPPQAPQLVSMRRIDGATWETVIVRADGTGDVGVWIGEWTGTKHMRFTVAPSALARLRHLVSSAARTGQTPALGHSPSVTYLLFADRRVFETAKDHVPARLATLTGILSGLIDRYS